LRGPAFLAPHRVVYSAFGLNALGTRAANGAEPAGSGRLPSSVIRTSHWVRIWPV